MPIKNIALRNTQLEGFAANIDRLELQDGTGAPLITFTLVWETPSGGTVATSAPASSTGVADGEAVAARYYSSTGTEEVTDLIVTDATGDGDIKLANPNIVVGQEVTLNQQTWTESTNVLFV